MYTRYRENHLTIFRPRGGSPPGARPDKISILLQKIVSRGHEVPEKLTADVSGHAYKFTFFGSNGGLDWSLPLRFTGVCRNSVLYDDTVLFKSL